MLGRKETNTSPANLAQVKEILTNRSKEPDFGYEQQTCLDYANSFCKLAPSDANKLLESLKQIEGMTDECAIKIVDLLPTVKSTVQVILAKDKIILDDSKLNHILELVLAALKDRISPPLKPKVEEALEQKDEPENTSD